MPDEKNETSFYLITENIFLLPNIFIRHVIFHFVKDVWNQEDHWVYINFLREKFADISKSLSAHMFGPANILWGIYPKKISDL